MTWWRATRAALLPRERHHRAPVCCALVAGHPNMSWHPSLAGLIASWRRGEFNHGSGAGTEYRLL